MISDTRDITFSAALREAMKEEMERDPRVIMMGEDIGKYGGAFKITLGLYERFGTERVRDTPISENAVVGAAIGAAIGGLIPVVEIQYAGFSTLVMDALVSQASLISYMSGGRVSVPMVVRMPICQNRGAGAQHSLVAPVSWLSHSPGLKVVAPSFPQDAKGLFKSAVRDGNPVIFIEHVELYRNWNHDIVSDLMEWLTPIGKAEVKRKGTDVTIIAYSYGVHLSLSAAKILAEKGVDSEVIDLRTLAPLDKQTVLQSVMHTGRAVVVDHDFRTAGLCAEIVSTICEDALYHLKAPVKRVTSPDVPVPFSPSLEKLTLFGAEDIARAALEIIQDS